MITLAQQLTSAIASLEEHCAFFDQGCTILEPALHLHEVLSTTTPEKISNFGQALKGNDRVNWIKGYFV